MKKSEIVRLIIAENPGQSIDKLAVKVMNDPRLKEPGFTIAQASKLVWRTVKGVSNEESR